MDKSNAPIALFCYNRLDHLKRTLEALSQNKEAINSKLFIFSDGAKDNKEDKKNVQIVRDYLKNISGFKDVEVFFRPINFGLSKSIISGVSSVFDKHESIIVLEDDLVTSKYFLNYMNNSLEAYKNEDRVACIHGYQYDIKGMPQTFFLKGADCWGWGTWKDSWKLFNPNGKELLTNLEDRNLSYEFNYGGLERLTRMLKNQINGLNDSWAIRWHASLFLADKLCLHPGKSMVSNIGQDGSGTHKGNSSLYNVNILNRAINIESIPIEVSKIALKKLKVFFFKSLFIKIINKILSTFHFKITK